MKTLGSLSAMGDAFAALSKQRRPAKRDARSGNFDLLGGTPISWPESTPSRCLIISISISIDYHFPNPLISKKAQNHQISLYFSLMSRTSITLKFKMLSLISKRSTLLSCKLQTE